jgi:hypothetical protein
MHSFARLCTAFGLNFSSFDAPALPAPDDPGAAAAPGRGVVVVERLSSRPFGGAIGFAFIAGGQRFAVLVAGSCRSTLSQAVTM